jgi:hypothetical protein
VRIALVPVPARELEPRGIGAGKGGEIAEAVEPVGTRRGQPVGAGQVARAADPVGVEVAVRAVSALGDAGRVGGDGAVGVILVQAAAVGARDTACDGADPLPAAVVVCPVAFDRRGRKCLCGCQGYARRALARPHEASVSRRTSTGRETACAPRGAGDH